MYAYREAGSQGFLARSYAMVVHVLNKCPTLAVQNRTPDEA